MAYCEPDDVRVRLPATLPEGKSYRTDERLEYSIIAADAQIDGRLRRFGVSLPLSPPVDPLIGAISSALAAADFLDGSFSGGGEDDPTSLSVRLREWGEAQLDLICSGDLALDGVDLGISAGDDGTVYIPAQHSHVGQTQELDCWDVMGP